MTIVSLLVLYRILGCDLSMLSVLDIGILSLLEGEISAACRIVAECNTRP